MVPYFSNRSTRHSQWAHPSESDWIYVLIPILSMAPRPGTSLYQFWLSFETGMRSSRRRPILSCLSSSAAEMPTNLVRVVLLDGFPAINLAVIERFAEYYRLQAGWLSSTYWICMLAAVCPIPDHWRLISRTGSYLYVKADGSVASPEHPLDDFFIELGRVVHHSIAPLQSPECLEALRFHRDGSSGSDVVLDVMNWQLLDAGLISTEAESYVSDLLFHDDIDHALNVEFRLRKSMIMSTPPDERDILLVYDFSSHALIYSNIFMVIREILSVGHELGNPAILVQAHDWLATKLRTEYEKLFVVMWRFAVVGVSSENRLTVIQLCKIVVRLLEVLFSAEPQRSLVELLVPVLTCLVPGIPLPSESSSTAGRLCHLDTLSTHLEKHLSMGPPTYFLDAYKRMRRILEFLGANNPIKEDEPETRSCFEQSCVRLYNDSVSEAMPSLSQASMLDLLSCFPTGSSFLTEGILLQLPPRALRTIRYVITSLIHAQNQTLLLHLTERDRILVELNIKRRALSQIYNLSLS